eukprot:275085-Chlamydomonas_euryale.AAC.1
MSPAAAARVRTGPECPASTPTHFMLHSSHTRMVPSYDPLNSRPPATVSARTASVWPVSCRSCVSVSRSHTCAPRGRVGQGG